MVGEEDIPTLVKAYIEGASERDYPVEICPLDQVDTFKIFGGFSDRGSRYVIGQNIVHGRFVDAIAYALQQDGFSGWNPSLSEETLRNCSDGHGYLERCEIRELTPSRELDALI